MICTTTTSNDPPGCIRAPRRLGDPWTLEINRIPLASCNAWSGISLPPSDTFKGLQGTVSLEFREQRYRVDFRKPTQLFLSMPLGLILGRSLLELWLQLSKDVPHQDQSTIGGGVGIKCPKCSFPKTSCLVTRRRLFQSLWSADYCLFTITAKSSVQLQPSVLKDLRSILQILASVFASTDAARGSFFKSASSPK